MRINMKIILLVGILFATPLLANHHSLLIEFTKPQDCVRAKILIASSPVVLVCDNYNQEKQRFYNALIIDKVTVVSSIAQLKKISAIKSLSQNLPINRQ